MAKKSNCTKCYWFRSSPGDGYYSGGSEECLNPKLLTTRYDGTFKRVSIETLNNNGKCKMFKIPKQKTIVVKYGFLWMKKKRVKEPITVEDSPDFDKYFLMAD